jgi:hypothetical protein
MMGDSGLVSLSLSFSSWGTAPVDRLKFVYIVEADRCGTFGDS